MRVVFGLRKPRRSGALGLAIVLLAVPIAAHSAELAMLQSLTKGSWNLRLRDNGAEQRICVRDGRELIQIRHKQPGCSRFVVEDGADHVVVQYTCRGNGYGRTSIRREASGLVQIESQGIIDGAPFALSGEARHSGAC
jgi:hypothetical protein